MNTLIRKFHFDEFNFEVYSEKPEFPFFHVHQTHSNIVLPVNDNNQGQEADGIIGMMNLPLAIKTADCLPVVLWNQNEVAFIHLGWRGLANQLLKNNKQLFGQYKKAFIGPCIHSCCFEVSEDFNLSFPNSQDLFLKNASKLTFDLVSECKKQIKQVFQEIEVLDSGLCTFCHLEFHSYRRNKTSQRQWNIIRKE